MSPVVTDHEVRALANHFTEDGPHVQQPQVVNYARFIRAVDEVFAIPELEKTPRLQVPKPGASVQTVFRPGIVDDETRVQQVLRRMALLTRTRGIDFKSCFQDCERSHATSLVTPRYSGKVSIAQFLQHFPFDKDFGEGDMKLLLRRYAVDSGTVHYLMLDHDIIEILQDMAARQGAMIARPPQTARPSSGRRALSVSSPSQAATDTSGELTARPSSGRRALSVSSHSHAVADPGEELMSKLRALVFERRLLLNGNFHDFDKLRKGVCTINQVSTVFTVLRIALSDTEMDLLADMFGDGIGGFCYRDFISAVTEAPLSSARLGVTEPPVMSSPSSRRQQLTLQSLARLEEVELRIAKRIRLLALPLRSTFQDFDRTSSGRVTRNQFKRVMDMMQCNLTDAQLELLLEVYCDPDSEGTGSSTSRFAYLKFCNSILGQDLFPGADCGQPCTTRTGRPPKYFNRSGQVMPLRCGNLLPRPPTR
mmetsp:Transcript_1237/g.2809  ORF Transcript_1237/g.2809 Transcript_1237/m.2809 type:complete len:480 (-) Transcript_1237:290-1729(-)